MKSIHLTNTKDMTYFYLPSLLFLVAMFIPNLWKHSMITFFVFIVLDIGHAYSTLLRTYFKKSHYFKPILAPVIFFSACFLYCFFGLPYFWSFIIYFTFFHHMRQNYGIFKWYSHLDHYQNKWDEVNIQVLAIVPFILFHTKTINYLPLYHETEFINFKGVGSMEFFYISYILYFLFASFKILKAFSKNKMSLSTTLSFLYPSALNLTCFLFFENSFQAFIPLLVFHATTYLSLIHLSEQKIQGDLFNPVKSWAKILLIIIIFGFGEKIITEYFDVFKDSTSMKGNILISLLVSISVLPNLMHYYLDGKIWKKDDPDFRKIISPV